MTSIFCTVYKTPWYLNFITWISPKYAYNLTCSHTVLRTSLIEHYCFSPRKEEEAEDVATSSSPVQAQGCCSDSPGTGWPRTSRLEGSAGEQAGPTFGWTHRPAKATGQQAKHSDLWGSCTSTLHAQFVWWWPWTWPLRKSPSWHRKRPTSACLSGLFCQDQTRIIQFTMAWQCKTIGYSSHIVFLNMKSVIGAFIARWKQEFNVFFYLVT